MKLAVIGSGPGAMYTIKYFLKHAAPLASNLRVDILEKLTKPFGLVGFGVAPDHPEVKEVAKEFASLVEANGSVVKLRTGFLVCDVDAFKSLKSEFDAVLIATGAQSASRLPFSSLPTNTMAARDFVLWYNGHPDFSDPPVGTIPRDVVVTGHGNVALDVARILSKSEEELVPLFKSGLLAGHAFEWLANRQSFPGLKQVHVLGRKGYIGAAFTNKEFRELTTLKEAVCRVNPADLEMPLDQLAEEVKSNRAKARGLSILAGCVKNFDSNTSVSNHINLRFGCKPMVYEGNPVTGMTVAHSDGSRETIQCQLGIESIGFKVTNEFGLPMDQESGGIAHDGHGRVVGHPGVYVAGWAKRGPKGVIAANIPCCAETADAMFHDLVHIKQ
jgi:thioredoxin reductase